MKINIDLRKANEELIKLGCDPYPMDAIHFEADNQEEMDSRCHFYEMQFNEWAAKQIIRS